MFMLWEFGPHVLSPSNNNSGAWYSRAVANSRFAGFVRDNYNSFSRRPELLSIEKFMTLYFTSAMTSSALSALVSKFRGNGGVFSIGASGAVSAVFTVSCLLFPDQRVRSLLELIPLSCSSILTAVLIYSTLRAASALRNLRHDVSANAAAVHGAQPRRRSIPAQPAFLHLRGREHVELLVLLDDAHLDVRLVHLALEALAQRQQRRVDGVFDLQVVVVTLPNTHTKSAIHPLLFHPQPLHTHPLEERLGADRVFADGRGLPAEVRARRVDLIQLRAVVVVARVQDGHAEGAHTARLRELLHDGRDLAHQDAGGRVLLVLLEVGLRLLARLAHQHAVVGAQAAVHDAGGLGQHRDLIRQPRLAASRQRFTPTADAQRRLAARVHGVERVLDLQQLSRRVEGRQTERVRRVRHGRLRSGYWAWRAEESKRSSSTMQRHFSIDSLSHGRRAGASAGLCLLRAEPARAGAIRQHHSQLGVFVALLKLFRLPLDHLLRRHGLVLLSVPARGAPAHAERLRRLVPQVAALAAVRGGGRVLKREGRELRISRGVMQAAAFQALPDVQPLRRQIRPPVQLAVSVEGFIVTSGAFLVQADNIFHDRGLTINDVDRTEVAKIMQSLVANNQALGFVTAMCLMTSIIVWVFVMMQLKRIAQNETANESFKREDLREEAELDGETSGRRMFRFLFRRLQFRKRPKLSVPRREQKKTLDASWGGLFSPDSIMNTEESFSVEDVDFNPYKLGSFKENLLDALHLRHSSDSKQKTN
ncbi:hypothetical protein ON010_g13472 [Phytophthora cinnamomi]|nr:hypothetical protein ON010_g13472 [Phytophthora cinnamomi]